MPPDMASSLYPDRPIRPLPKRRLREKLSPEVAESIRYPPSTFSSMPLFQYPPYLAKDDLPPSSPRSPGSASPPSVNARTPRTNYTTDRRDDGASRSAAVVRSSPEILSNRHGNSSNNGRSGRPPAKSEQPASKPPEPVQPPSTASSVDGYDSFENTNNKKKRKIPSAGDSALNGLGGGGGGADANSHAAGVTAAVAEIHGSSTTSSLGSGSSSSGMSGSGRGRLARSINGRSPLRTLPDGNNTWASRPAKGGTPQWASENQGGGIISAAIANAEKLPPQTQVVGQENVSLLDQGLAKSPPASTQFTFTCESQVPGSLPWPGTTKTMPPQPSPNGASTTDGPGEPPRGTGRHGASKRKQRFLKQRELNRELNRQAEDRRRETQERNARNPPKEEDDWVCDICQYERIYGEPPRALIRAYELKDLEVRRQEAERKRLLEKAKAKGRKSRRAPGAKAAKDVPSHGVDSPADFKPGVHYARRTPFPERPSSSGWPRQQPREPAAEDNGFLDEYDGLDDYQPPEDPVRAPAYPRPMAKPKSRLHAQPQAQKQQAQKQQAQQQQAQSYPAPGEVDELDRKYRFLLPDMPTLPRDTRRPAEREAATREVFRLAGMSSGDRPVRATRSATM